MALDAFVYCDCYEKDNLRCDPPNGIALKLAPNGELTCDASSDASWMAFNAWKLAKACLHEGMILVRHRLGDDELVDRIRAELQRQGEHFPILLNDVVYSSTHTCDWIRSERFPALIEELKRLQTDLMQSPARDAMHHFKIQIAELIIAAQLMRKPICF